MSLIRYVQDETSLSALSSASKAATSDVEDSGQDPGKRPSDRIKGNCRMKTKRVRSGASERARDDRVKKEKRGLTDSSLKITSSANETSWTRLGPT